MKPRLVGLFLLFLICTFILRHYAASIVARVPDPTMPTLVAQDDVLRPAVPMRAPTSPDPRMQLQPPHSVSENSEVKTDSSGRRYIERTIMRPVVENQFREQQFPSGERRRVPVAVSRLETETQKVFLPPQMAKEEVHGERRLLELAARYRSEESGEEKAAIREQMDEVARELLDLQQTRWTDKIDELTEQLEKLKSLQEERKEREDEIVERRINELLSEPHVLDWDPLGPQAGARSTLLPGGNVVRSTQPAPVVPGMMMPGHPQRAPARHIRSFQSSRKDEAGRQHPLDVHVYEAEPTETPPSEDRSVPVAPRAPTAPTAPNAPRADEKQGQRSGMLPSTGAAERQVNEARTRMPGGEHEPHPAQWKSPQDAVRSMLGRVEAESQAARAFDIVTSARETATAALRSAVKAQSLELRLQHRQSLSGKQAYPAGAIEQVRRELNEARREATVQREALEELKNQLKLEQQVAELEIRALEEARAHARAQHEAGDGHPQAVAASEAALERAMLQREAQKSALDLLRRLEQQIAEATAGEKAEEPITAESESEGSPEAEEGEGEDAAAADEEAERGEE